MDWSHNIKTVILVNAIKKEELKRISGRSYVVLVWLELELPLCEKMSLPLLLSQQCLHAWEELGHYLSGVPARKLHVKIVSWNGERWGREGAQVENFRNVVVRCSWPV